METYKYLYKLWAPSSTSSSSNPPSPSTAAAGTLPTPPPTPPPQLPAEPPGSSVDHSSTHRDPVSRERMGLDLTLDEDDDHVGAGVPTVDPDAGAQGDMLDVKTPPQPGDTLYLSARRRPPSTGAESSTGDDNDDGRPLITIREGVPAHLQGAVRAELERRASLGKSAHKGKGKARDENEEKSELVGGQDGDDPSDTDTIPIMRPANKVQDATDYNDNKVVKHEETDAEGERLLAIKQKQRQRQRQRYQISRSWPVRLSVSVYVLLRHLLSWLGVPYSPRSPHNALLAPTPAPPPYSELKSAPSAIDPDSTTSPDELLDSLQKSSDHQSPSQPPTPTRSSLFPWRSSAPSRTPSPSPTPALVRPTPKPPRLTPKVLVLDLDETLIHSTSRPYASSKKNQGLKVRVVEVVLDGRSTVYTVYKRPWVDFFLRKVSTWYTVIIFTASLPEYADPVIDWLDGGDGGGGMVGGRLFRSDCVHANGSYVKDLSVVDPDLSRVCLVDNSPVSYAINQANGIPIEGWINDPNDECLLDLLPMLDSLRFTSDVRRVLGLRGFGR